LFLYDFWLSQIWWKPVLAFIFSFRFFFPLNLIAAWNFRIFNLTVIKRFLNSFLIYLQGSFNFRYDISIQMLLNILIFVSQIWSIRLFKVYVGRTDFEFGVRIIFSKILFKKIIFFFFFLLFYFKWLLFYFLIFFGRLCLKAFFIIFRRLCSINLDLVQLFQLRHIKNNETDVFLIA